MTRYKLTIEYDGRPFVGWQRQKQGATVQEALEAATEKFDGMRRAVQGAGRTDAGVHALGQVAHVDIERPMTADGVMGAFNHHLKPYPVAVTAVEHVQDDFNARFSATARHYVYKLICRRSPLTFDAGLVWRHAQILDIETMREAAAHLVGEHDFTTFRHVYCQAKSPFKTLDYLDIDSRDEGPTRFINFRTGARSFLHSQVRSMVGCLSLVGRGHWTPDDMKAARDARNRQALGFNAPPDGLYLARVDYGARSEKQS